MKKRNLRGLTLVETIVVAAVFALLTLTVTQLLTGGLRAWNKAQVRNKLRGDARAAIDLISSEFRMNTTDALTGQPKTVAPAVPSVAEDNRLTITRYDSTDTSVSGLYTVLYTIDDNAKTLVRFDSKSNTTTTIAENVVGLDPADNTKRKSYFQWDSTKTCMNIYLTVADYRGDPASIPDANTLANRDQVSLKTSAFYMANTSSAAGNAGPATMNLSGGNPLALPADLRDPRRVGPRT